MMRREFIAYMTTASGLLPIVLTQIACESPTGSSSGSDVYLFTSSSDSGHTHSVSIKKDDVSLPPASAKTITTSGPSHTHTIVLTIEDYRALSDGTQIVKASSNSGGHTHEFTMVIAGANGTGNPSGNGLGY